MKTGAENLIAGLRRALEGHRAALEAAFAAQPPLFTPAAEKAGFAHDGDLATLVSSALATLS